MKLTLVAVGTKMPSWVKEGYKEYEKRLPKELKPKLIELAVAPRAGNHSTNSLKQQEAKAILNAIPQGAIVVVLDVLGRNFKTEDLAAKLSQWQMSGQDLCFVIGGPDGLSEEVLQKASVKWSLSALTMPHPLVRIVFIEQIYRGWTILQNHPYHK